MRTTCLLAILTGVSATNATWSWVSVNGVDLTPTFASANIVSLSNVSSIETCSSVAAANHKLYATLGQDKVCKTFDVTYTYKLADGVTSAARYNSDDYECFGSANFEGDDTFATNSTRFDRCLDSCKNLFDATTNERCNAVSWIQQPGESSGRCYFKFLKNPLREPRTNVRGAIACRSRSSVFHALGVVKVDGITFEQGGSVVTKPRAGTLQECARIMAQSGRYANYHRITRYCAVLDVSYKYTLSPSSTGLVKYNTSDYVCTGNGDFFGEDIWDSAMRFDRCLDTCKDSFSSTSQQPCNAVTWVATEGQDMGRCYLKYLHGDRPAGPNALGAISCKKSPLN
ncbi:hypothetical protein LEN26_007152 [Aphanomyces euteiches]|nr:hypothetical protein AeMF1_018187 [Aphanomyces euteiches]KAH9133189.1 hypothetical protein LEN26_007152 [Aphanomyces euteiches]